MSQPKAQLIDPREHGQRALELKRPVFDAAAVARAEGALGALSEAFPAWLENDIAKIQTARLAAESDCWSNSALESLHVAAHDLKGLGATYGYPIVTQIAASLCRLIETKIGKQVTRQNPVLARAHVDALRAAVRAGVRDETHAAGRLLLRELESQVASLDIV